MVRVVEHLALTWLFVTTAYAQLAIDGEEVFGVPWGSAPEEMVASQGKPIGIIRLNDLEYAYFYGGGVALRYDARKLVAVYLDQSGLLDRELGEGVSLGLSAGSLRIGPGVEFLMTPAELERVLGTTMGEPGYSMQAVVGGLRYHFRFMSMTRNGTRSYRLNMLILRPGPDAADDGGGLDITEDILF